MSDVKKYWMEGTRFFERPPNKPFIPREGKSFAPSQVVLAEDHDAEVARLTAALTASAQRVKQLEEIETYNAKYQVEQDEKIKQATAAVEEMRGALQDMVDMMESGDEHGEGSKWYLKAKAALAQQQGRQG